MPGPIARPLPPDQERLYRLRDVEAITGLRRSSIYARIRDGAFPAPIKLGISSAWRKSDVDRWLVSVIDRADRAA